MLQLAAVRRLPAIVAAQPRKRLAIGAGACFLLLALVFAAVAALRDSSVPLFARSLGAEQAGEVQLQLASWNVRYSVAGDQIRVDPAVRNETLAKLAVAGIPHVHVDGSSDRLRDVSALTPQSVVDAQMREGLEGDLALAIRGMAGIGDARVIVAPATRGYFSDESAHPATASVRIRAADGAGPTPGTIDGIKQFVASAVPGLDASRVTVVDDRGVSLGGTADVAAAGDREKELQGNLQSALDAAIGAGRSIVRVHVDASATAVVAREFERRPASSAPLASRKRSETYHGERRSYEKVDASEDRGARVVERDTRTRAGVTQRITVAVVLDERARGDEGKVRTIVTSAAGLRPSRGDAVSVVSMPLAGIAVPPPSRSAAPGWTSLVPGLAALIAFIAALPFVAKSSFGLLGLPAIGNLAGSLERPARRSAPVACVSPPHDDAIRILALIADEPPHTAASIVAELSTATATAVLDGIPAARRREILERMTQAASISPLAREVRARATERMRG